MTRTPDVPTPPLGVRLRRSWLLRQCRQDHRASRSELDTQVQLGRVIDGYVKAADARRKPPRDGPAASGTAAGAGLPADAQDAVKNAPRTAARRCAKARHIGHSGARGRGCQGENGGRASGAAHRRRSPIRHSNQRASASAPTQSVPAVTAARSLRRHAACAASKARVASP